MDRTEIGNCIIAGIIEDGTTLERMSEVVTRLELAGWVIVPREPTQEMVKAGASRSVLRGGYEVDVTWKLMIDAALARS